MVPAVRHRTSRESRLRYKPTTEIRELNFAGLISLARRNVVGKTHGTERNGQGAGAGPRGLQGGGEGKVRREA